MKFYNPFKPHICKNVDDTYSVRKWTISGWEKADMNKYWWTIVVYQHEFCHFSAEDALVLLDVVNAPTIKLRDEYVSTDDLRQDQPTNNR